jgi:hypothetical protein
MCVYVCRSDTYCYINQCQSSGQPVGARLFPPEQDAAFRKSIGGMIWPRCVDGSHYTAMVKRSLT